MTEILEKNNPLGPEDRDHPTHSYIVLGTVAAPLISLVAAILAVFRAEPVSYCECTP